MSNQNEFPDVFKKLKSILKPYAKQMTVKTDTPETYYLDGPYSTKWKKEVFFGAVQIKKNYVSFYLMPVYMFPELKKHMQGKSCFNFKTVNQTLFDELNQLTEQGFKRFTKEVNF